jgi:hypothetical protein
MMDVVVIPEERIPAVAVIHVPQDELVRLLVRQAVGKNESVRVGKCLRVAMDYTQGPCVLEVKIEQPAETERKQE